MYKRKLNNYQNNKQNNKKIKKSPKFGLFGSLPVEIWYIIFEYYQSMIKIHTVSIRRIRGQKEEQSSRERFQKFNYVNKYSYLDIQNVAMLNSGFYDYWYRKIFQIELIQENSKFMIKRKNKLVSLKHISDNLYEYYNIHSNLCFMDNTKKLGQYIITEKQYEYIKIQFNRYQIKSTTLKKKFSEEKKIQLAIPEININNSIVLSSIFSSSK